MSHVARIDVPPPRSELVDALARFSAGQPNRRKLLVGPDLNWGRELLVTLARTTGGWIGWEATSVRGIAGELAFVPLAARGLRVGSDVDIGALVERALSDEIDAGRTTRPFAQLARTLGFRRSLRDVVLELRVAGIDASELRSHAATGSPARDCAAVLERYTALLRRSGLADSAEVLRVALEAFDAEAPFALDAAIALAPSLGLRGLPGALARRLVTHGATILGADTPDGLPIPANVLAAMGDGAMPSARAPLAFVAAPALATCDLFAAATPSDELREICRRVLSEGWRWEDVEIVVTDTDTYGIALDALSQHIGVGVTMLQGIPLARTRLGRALERWLTWIGDGLPADVMRQALEAGDIRLPGSDASPESLARELRALRIGWGRERWMSALARLEDGSRLGAIRQREDESDEELAVRKAARRPLLDALAALVRRLLTITPEVPARDAAVATRARCSTLARATVDFLALVPHHGPAEEQTLERLRRRLERVGALEDETSGFSTALAALREHLADLRAWPLVTDERKPWSANGGRLHVTDLAHAGTTGRPRTFVAGLDADRTSGPARQDPLLPDAIRRALGDGRVPTSIERREERAWQVASALATLRGRVTLSYATRGALDGREAGPSPLLLQAMRLTRGDASLSYEALRGLLHPPVSPVPARDATGALAGVVALDARDCWLDALAAGALLLDGAAAVRAAFPALAHGLDAHEAALAPAPSEYHGLVTQAGAVLDPTANPDREISPSSLEKLAACPLSWFYRYGLSLRPTQDPEYDAGAWLDALQRGSLLHEVFEQFTTEYRGRQEEILDVRATDRMREIAAERLAAWRDDVPPPGELVFGIETAEVQEAARAFLEMERAALRAGDGGRWEHIEMEFGGGAATAPYVLPDGRLFRVRGRADRVDRLPDGTLRVVDYKTGGTFGYEKERKAGAFRGGRRLQPALYASVVEAVTGARVTRFEYRFPTERGRNEIVGYDAAELRDARPIVATLLAHVRAGEFVPTNDGQDCRYCDYGSICRLGDGGAPRAAWAKEYGPALALYAPMLARRGAAPVPVPEDE